MILIFFSFETFFSKFCLNKQLPKVICSLINMSTDILRRAKFYSIIVQSPSTFRLKLFSAVL